MNKEAALVVFSGGQDSTTCLFWAKREFRKVYALSFLYGQKHQKEVELAREIARKAEVEFEVMDVSFIGKLGHNSLTDPDMVMDREKPADSVPNTFVPGRNLFFLSIAAVYAREKGIGLDFNPTYFSHPMLRDNWTLASPEKEVRDFWVQHGIACRKIGEYFGRELGEVCITNHWIPDGSKDTRVDTLGPRERLVESLDRIFAEPIDRKYNRDSIEGKVFGLGLESYTAGSHEFYTNYALTTGKAMVCMDTGHYHPTESVAAKLSSYFVFGQEIMTHLSRAVRWDSDHVAIVSEDTVAIMQEIKRCNAFDKVHLGLDFFDASIDRVSASVIGARSVKKALMIALLEPTDKLMEAEREGNFTRRLALLEEFKMLPAGIVFDEYCRRHDMPGADWAAKL